MTPYKKRWHWRDEDCREKIVKRYELRGTQLVAVRRPWRVSVLPSWWHALFLGASRRRWGVSRVFYVENDTWVRLGSKKSFRNSCLDRPVSFLFISILCCLSICKWFSYVCGHSSTLAVFALSINRFCIAQGSLGRGSSFVCCSYIIGVNAGHFFIFLRRSCGDKAFLT